MPDAMSSAAAPSDRHPGVLPDRLHLDHLRRQARDLHRALKQADVAALQRAAPYRVDAGASLAQAQLVLAREYGFASWPLLVEEVAQRRARGRRGRFRRRLAHVGHRPGRPPAAARARLGVGAHACDGTTRRGARAGARLW